MLALRIVGSIPLWLLRGLLLLVLAAMGIPVIATLAWRGCYEPRPSRHFKRTVPQFPRWAWLWNNQEDGVDGLRGGDRAQAWWLTMTSDFTPLRRVFKWSAFRNPVDSLRFIPLLNPKIDPARVRSVGMDREPQDGESGWYFAWQGLYSCIRWEFELSGVFVLAIAIFLKSWRDGDPVFMRFWLGWKIKPTDAGGLAPDDPRAIRCDFAAQFKRVS